MQRNKIALQKQLEFYTNLLTQHERQTAEKQSASGYEQNSKTQLIQNSANDKLLKKSFQSNKYSENINKVSTAANDLSDKSKINMNTNLVCHDKKINQKECKKSDSKKLMTDILTITQQLKLKSEKLDSSGKMNSSLKSNVCFQEKKQLESLTSNTNDLISQNKYSFKKSSKNKSSYLCMKSVLNSSSLKTKASTSVINLKPDLKNCVGSNNSSVKTHADLMKELNSLKETLARASVNKNKKSIKAPKDNDVTEVTPLQKEYMLREKLLKKQLEKKTKVTQSTNNVIENKNILPKVYDCDKMSLLNSKYKIINKAQTPNKNLRTNDLSKSVKKIKRLHTFGKKAKDISPKFSNVLNSKYKIINKVQTPIKNLRTSDVTKSVKKLKRLSTSGKKAKNKFKLINVNNEKCFTSSSNTQHFENRNKLNNCLHKQNSNFKFNVFNASKQRNVYISSSKYNCYQINKNNAVVNRVKNNTVNKFVQNSGVDVDLLLELAAEKQSMLLKRNFKKQLYKSKHFMNNCSQQTKTARMIKSKYFSPNKRIYDWKQNSVYKNYKGLHKSNISKRQLNGNKTRKNHHSSIKIFQNKFYSVKQTSHKKRILHVGGEKYVIGSSGKSLKKISRKSLNSPKNYQQSVLQRKSILKNMSLVKSSTPVSKIIANRALNRSINQALSASSKKKLHKVNNYCMFYNRFGRCNKGVQCQYVHDPSKIAICTRFLRGTCKNDTCLFSHEINPGKMAICSFFLKDECTKVNCPYGHEKLSSDAELCKAFVQGYCSMGKDCKKAHVLICPKYIQGLCEKGSDCVFPHPKDKEKKLVPKSESSTKKIEENLLETVSRYFQSNPEENLDKGSCVPKRKTLAEQPSFISLT